MGPKTNTFQDMSYLLLTIIIGGAGFVFPTFCHTCFLQTYVLDIFEAVLKTKSDMYAGRIDNASLKVYVHHCGVEYNNSFM